MSKNRFGPYIVLSHECSLLGFSLACYMNHTTLICILCAVYFSAQCESSQLCFKEVTVKQAIKYELRLQCPKDYLVVQCMKMSKGPMSGIQRLIDTGIDHNTVPDACELSCDHF